MGTEFLEDKCKEAKKNNKCSECWQYAIAHKAVSDKIEAANAISTELKEMISCKNSATYSGKVIHDAMGTVVRDYTNSIIEEFKKNGI